MEACQPASASRAQTTALLLHVLSETAVQHGAALTGAALPATALAGASLCESALTGAALPATAPVGADLHESALIGAALPATALVTVALMLAVLTDAAWIDQQGCQSWGRHPAPCPLPAQPVVSSCEAAAASSKPAAAVVSGWETHVC